MSQILDINGKLFAIGLYWHPLVGHGPINRQIAREAKTQKASRYLRHLVNEKQRGLVDENDSYGFFAGKSLRIARNAKVYALASLFARSGEAQSIWVFKFDEDQFVVLGSKNGHPVLDEIHSTDSVIKAAAEYKRNFAINGARLYLYGDIDSEVKEELSEQFEAVEQASASFFEPEEAARLLPVPNASTLTPYIGVAFIASIAWYGWQFYETQHALQEAAKHAQTPEQAYRASRDAALAQTSFISTSAFVSALRAAPLWKNGTTLVGWNLESINCSMSGAATTCIRTWKRSGGTFEGLKKALSVDLVPVSLESATDKSALQIKPIDIDTTVPALSSELETQYHWGTYLQRLKDAARFTVSAGQGPSEKNAGQSFAADIKPVQLIGNAPPGAAQGNFLVSAGPWEVSGGIAWLGDLELLPPQFLVSAFTLSAESNGKFSFKISGIYLVRPQSVVKGV